MAILSKNKFSNMMIDALLQLPEGTKNLKKHAVQQLGFIGQISTTRDITAAWNEAKKKVSKQYPDKFLLDDRGILHWNDGNVKIVDKNISNPNFKKLNELANSENCNVNTLVTKLISNYKKK